MPKRNADYMQGQRDLILDAALKCFADKGLHRTSIDDIGRTARLSKGALYVHFPSKEAIVNALIERGVRMYTERGPKSVAEMHHWIGDIVGRPDKSQLQRSMRFGLRFAAESLGDRRLARWYDTYFELYYRLTDRLLDRDPRTSALPAHDRASLIRQLLYYWCGLSYYMMIMPSLDRAMMLRDSERAVEAMVSAAALAARSRARNSAARPRGAHRPRRARGAAPLNRATRPSSGT
jgi:AcrR family transcriptional regulator